MQAMSPNRRICLVPVAHPLRKAHYGCAILAASMALVQFTPLQRGLQRARLLVFAGVE